MIITDSQFDTVYLSSYFLDIDKGNKLYPLNGIFRDLTDRLKGHNVRTGAVPRKDEYGHSGYFPWVGYEASSLYRLQLGRWKIVLNSI